MPKTKTTQKTAKQPAFLQRTISANSSKGRLIIFLLAFAVIGGGVMLYNSFAASTSQTAFYDKIYATVQPASVASETTGSKKGNKVWDLGTNGTVMANVILPPLSDGAPFQICANLKVSQAGSVGFIFGSAYKGGAQTVYVTASTDYKKYCINLTSTSTYPVAYSPGIVNSTNGDVRVGYIQLNYDSDNACYVSGEYVSGQYTSGTTIQCKAYGTYTSYASY
jgi:hypothetical protein